MIRFVLIGFVNDNLAINGKVEESGFTLFNIVLN